MTALFKKGEMIGRLAFKSAENRTLKETLPTEKYIFNIDISIHNYSFNQVELIVRLVTERFPITNLKELKEAMNQKCR